MRAPDIRDQICRYGRALFERGLTPGSSGNIGVRLDDGRLVMTLTDAAGRHLSGDRPTKEGPLHRALYETRQGSGAAVRRVDVGFALIVREST